MTLIASSTTNYIHSYGSGYILFCQTNRESILHNMKLSQESSYIGDIDLRKELSKQWKELDEIKKKEWTKLANDIKKESPSKITTKLISGHQLFIDNIYHFILKTDDRKYDKVIDLMWNELSYQDKESWNRQARINRMESFNH